MRRSCAGLVMSAMMLVIFAAPGRAAPAGSDAVDKPAAPPPATPLREVFSADEITRLKALLEEEQRLERAARCKPKVRFYGFLKADVAYDSNATSTGDFARWVESEAFAKEDDQFSLTARETRLGVEIKGPNSCNLEIDGRVEIDFYGAGSEYAEQLKLRHGYIRLYWPQHRLAVLAGQTWDTNVPLHMPTINYTVGWWAGNLGFRRPQVRLTKDFALGRRSEAKLEIAAARTVSLNVTAFTPPGEDTGEDAGIPSVQGRLSFSGEESWGDKATLGLSGHYGREEWDRDAADNHDNFDTWSLALDLTLPLNPCLKLCGEAWLGSNLSSYFGGIGQGINTTVAGAEHQIDSHGGWLALTWTPSSRWCFSTGGAFDDPKNGDLSAGMRALNATGFVNAWYRLRKPLGIGMELSYWYTEYIALAKGDSLRVQMSVKYEF